MAALAPPLAVQLALPLAVQVAPPLAVQVAPPSAVQAAPPLAVQIPWHLLLDPYPPMTIIIIILELVSYLGLPMFFNVSREKSGRPS